MIYGKSGSGKSRSLKNFAPDEIFLINVVGKRLPFPGTFRYQMKTDSYQTITNGLQKMPTKTAVIDDAGYLLTNTFMKGHSAPKAGSSTFDLYNDIADNFWRLLMFIQAQLPEDLTLEKPSCGPSESCWTRRFALRGWSPSVCAAWWRATAISSVPSPAGQTFRNHRKGFSIWKLKMT